MGDNNIFDFLCYWLDKNVTLHFGQFFLFVFVKLCSVSVSSKPENPPGRPTPGDSHVLFTPGVGFSLLCLARGSAWGVFPGGRKSK